MECVATCGKLLNFRKSFRGVPRVEHPRSRHFCRHQPDSTVIKNFSITQRRGLLCGCAAFTNAILIIRMLVVNITGCFYDDFVFRRRRKRRNRKM